MQNQMKGIGIGLGAAVLAVALWSGLTRTGEAQQVVPAGGSVRYMLQSSTDSTMYMVDSWTGDTWTLVGSGVDARNLRQWSRMREIETGPRARRSE